MMKHDILVKYKPEVMKERKAELIPEIHDVALYPNVVERENRYDLMIEIDMEREALEAYDNSVWHRQWKEQYGSLLASKAIFDRI